MDSEIYIDRLLNAWTYIRTATKSKIRELLQVLVNTGTNPPHIPKVIRLAAPDDDKLIDHGMFGRTKLLESSIGIWYPNLHLVATLLNVHHSLLSPAQQRHQPSLRILPMTLQMHQKRTIRRKTSPCFIHGSLPVLYINLLAQCS